MKINKLKMILSTKVPIKAGTGIIPALAPIVYVSLLEIILNSIAILLVITLGLLKIIPLWSIIVVIFLNIFLVFLESKSQGGNQNEP